MQREKMRMRFGKFWRHTRERSSLSLLRYGFGLWALLLVYCALPSSPLLAQSTAPAQNADVVIQTIRYHLDTASEVMLVWGVNGWATVPEAERPTGTTIQADGLMYTPMTRAADAFVAQLHVPSGTKIDYVFRITKEQDGSTVELWDTNTAPQKDYHTIAAQGGVADITPRLTPSQDQPQASSAASGLATQEIRYQLPDASEVMLVWGIDGWGNVPEASRPLGTELQDGLMYTPMLRVGEKFAVRVQVPADTTIDYVFKITQNRAGNPIEVWDTNGTPKQDYHTKVTQNGVAEVQAMPEVQDQVRNAIQNNDRRWLWLLLAIISCGIAGVGIVSYRPGFYPLVGIGAGITLPRWRILERPSLRATTLVLIAILAVAAALRLNHITQPFTDAFSWRQTSVAMMADNFYHTSWNIFYPAVNWSGPDPGYQGREFQTISYISALLYLVLGQHDWIGRGVAVLFGLWGIFALYQLVRRVWDEEHALIAAAVMAVIPGSIIVERSFLPDPAMVALVVTSFWMFVTYLQTERPRYLVLASVIGAWGFCTKIPGLIVGLPMLYAVVAILGQRTLASRKLAALAAFGVFTLAPVAGYYLWARHLALSYPPYHFAGDGNWLWQDGLQRWLEQRYFLDALGKHFSGWIWMPPMIALVALGLIARAPQFAAEQGDGSIATREPKKARWIFHIWFLAGVIYYSIGAQELNANPWNYHILNPAAAALAAHAIILITGLARRIIARPLAAALPIAILALIVGFGQYGLRDWYRAYSLESYTMGVELSRLSNPGDLVVTIGHDYGDPVAIYYSQRRGWGFPPADPSRAWDRLPENAIESNKLFDELRAQGADWLGIVNEHHDEIWQEHEEFAKYIEQTCELKATTADYVIYRILSPSELAHHSAGQ